MNAQELRIGNLVQLYRRPSDSDKSIHSVKDILKHKKTYFISLADDFMVNIENGIEPIPLTEEWYCMMPEWFADLIRGGYLNASFLPCGFIEVEHVHTAQNLHFALTNEELKLKQND